MPLALTARDIDDILVRWEAGEVTHRVLHEWAEHRSGTHNWEPACEVTNEVLGHLDRMDMNLVMPRDVTMLMQALATTTVEEACRLIDACYTAFSIAARKLVCAADDFYAPFCK
jgi:hypothetical protein